MYWDAVDFDAIVRPGLHGRCGVRPLPLIPPVLGHVLEPISRHTIAPVISHIGTGSVEQALNYKSVAKRLQSFVEGSEFQLVETLAEKTAAMIIEEFEVPWLRLKVNKRGALRGAVDVGIVIERSAT